MTGKVVANLAAVMNTTCVYVLRSASDRERHYIGLTADLATRLAAHNAGASPHTARHRPWRIVVAVQFDSQQAAIDFERYLKTSSGRAFVQRYFR